MAEKLDLIASALTAHPFLDAVVYPPNTVRFQLSSTAPFNEIDGVVVSEWGTGEDLTAVKDQPTEEEMPPKLGILTIIGESEGDGVIRLQIGDGPLVEVSTEGRSAEALAEALARPLQDLYADFPYEINLLGPHILIYNLPCPEGIAAGTDVPALAISFGLLPLP